MLYECGFLLFTFISKQQIILVPVVGCPVDEGLHISSTWIALRGHASAVTPIMEEYHTDIATCSHVSTV